VVEPVTIVCPQCRSAATTLSVVDADALETHGLAGTIDYQDDLFTLTCHACGHSCVYRESSLTRHDIAGSAPTVRQQPTPVAVRKAVYGEQVDADRQVWRPEIAFVAVISLALIGIADYYTTWSVSLSTFYVLPVGLVAWNIGRRAGVWFCTFAAVTRLTTNLTFDVPYATGFWNAGMLFGVLLMVAMLLCELRMLGQPFPFQRVFRTTLFIGLAVAFLGAAVGLALDRLYPHGAAAVTRSAAPVTTPER